MKPEQKMGAIFTLFGAAMGLLSNTIGSNLVGGFLPIGLYAGSLFLVRRVYKEKKPIWLVSNSLIIFFLTWFIAWVLLFNSMQR